MKILHTSDWHLGHELYGNNRAEEQDSFLRQIADIASKEQPDAMVVSGDIFHTSTPSIAAQQLLTDGILRIHDACRRMQIVVTGGNHDSASRLEIDSQLWKLAGVHVLGTLHRDANGRVNLDDHVITLPGKGIIVAIPHIYHANYPAVPDEESVSREAAFFHSVMHEVNSRDTDGLPVVLMAHLAVESMDGTGHRDADSDIGTMELLPIDTFGEGYDYLALGHIHRPQTIRNTDGRIRYSGTPIEVSFDEDYSHKVGGEQLHSVSIVEVEHGQRPVVTKVPIRNIHPLMTIPAEPVTFEEAIQTLENFPDDDPSYIRLNILSSNGLPSDCNARAAQAAENKACQFCTFVISVPNHSREHHRSWVQSRSSLDEFLHKGPMEVADLYMAETGISDADKASYRTLMSKTLDAIQKEERM